jgi:D-alanyl-lipoteichoic acid acyltransferase DltB (MBOAT superfamily)
MVGIRQILWGFFMKLVVADNCAPHANYIFDNSGSFNGSTLWLGGIFFAFQIYGDFAGYSNIAIGTSRLFGFSLMQNFAFPYFSRDIAEFWRRWHISLSTWFRDYLYIPLGGSMGTTFHKIRNIFIIFIVSGFWHGANWTFIAWGMINAIYFLPLLIQNKNRENIDIVSPGKLLPTPTDALKMVFTFLLTVIAWIFFRAENVTQALVYIEQMFSATLFMKPEVLPIKVIVIIILFVIIEWLGRKDSFAIETIGKQWPTVIKWASVYTLLFIIYLLGNYSTSFEFIYFQF